MTKRYGLGNAEVDLHFIPTESGFGLNFRINKDGWREVSKPNQPLIKGKNFNLYPRKIRQRPREVILTGGETNPFKATINFLDQNWFRFEIELRVEKPITLDHTRGVEPALVFELPDISVQREGGLIWEQTLVPNPILDAQGVQATDLPAAFYYDPVTEAAWAYYLDWESLSWANHENIFGFLGGQCGLHTQLTTHPETPQRTRQFGFQAFNPNFVGNKFPAGKHSFIFYLQVQPGTKLTEWEANEKLVTGIAPFIKTKPAPNPKKLDWTSLTTKGLRELVEKPEVAQIPLKEGLGLRAYGQIGHFEDPNPAQRVELMTSTDVVWPLLFWQKLDLPGLDKKFFADLNRLVPAFYDNQYQFIGNWFPHEDQLKPQDQETWYFLENGLVKIGWIARLKKDSQLKKQFLAFAETCRKMASSYNYLFPLRYDWHVQKTSGARKNYISAGLYAYGMMIAYQLTKKRKWLREAKEALSTIQRLPLELLNHEPQQTGFGALAAYHLFEETSKPEWREFGWQLVYHQLRMFYWYTDRTVWEALGCDTAGQARSFPSKIYPVIKHNPAFKENVESYLPWLYLILKDRPQAPLLDLINLARQNNFYYFDKYQGIEENFSWMPLESLPALPESGGRHQGGGVGHAIYGFGEVVWNALIFETFASCPNKEIMVLWLDALDPNANLKKDLHLIVYNPTDKKVKTQVELTNLPFKPKKIHLSHPSRTLKAEIRSISVRLEPRSYTYLTISAQNHAQPTYQ